MKKIYIARDPFLEETLDEVASTLSSKGWEVVRGPDIVPGVKLLLAPDQRERLLAEVEIAVVSSRSRILAEDLDAAECLNALIFPTIGVDAVDLLDCSSRGIIVGHGAAPENFLAMAEATVMLMLVLSYRLHESERLLRENEARPRHMHGRMLQGRQIGLIGLGRIGTGVVERLADWGVEVVVYDPYISEAKAGLGIRLVGLDELLATSDIVSLHVPLNAETRGILDRKALLSMKRNAILINTSRGGLIDEAALIEVMGQEHLGGAALDVFETEPLPVDSGLRSIDRLVLTPHILGHTVDLSAVMSSVMLDNIERVSRGELPLYTRNPEATEAWRQRLARANFH